MAESNAVVGQTYNAKQQRVYPKVVAQSFVIDSEVSGSSVEFNNVVKDTISRMDELTPQKITLGINGSIVVRSENTVRNFLFLSGNGEMQFESDHIKDKEGYVKIFNDKVVVDSGSLTISHPIIATDASLIIKDIDTSVLTARIVDTSTLILSDGLDIDTIDVSVLNVSYDASIVHLGVGNLTVDETASIRTVEVDDVSVYNSLLSPTIKTGKLIVSDGAEIKTLDASGITSSISVSTPQVDASNISVDNTIKAGTIDTENVTISDLLYVDNVKVNTRITTDELYTNIVDVTDASVTNLSAKKITIPNAILLKQIKELPSPDETHAEEILQYIGPTQHETSTHIQKYDFVRCVMNYNAQNELDASVCLYTDFDSFEPTTTLKWLESNNIPPVSTDGEISEYEFTLIWESDKYVVSVKNRDDDYVTIGGDIYSDHSSPKRHIYCPYVWDESYVPSIGPVLTYSITFNRREYAWKPVR